MKKHLLLFLIICIHSLSAQNPNFSFAKSIGGTGNESGYTTTVDASGNILVGGLFSGTVDFDPGPGITSLTSIEYGDGYVTKLDANGNFLWAYQIGGLNNDYINGIATDASGNVYVTGQTGTADLLIYKLSASGSLMWSMVFGSTGGTESGNGIVVDDLGNVYVVGECMGTIDFDRGAGVANLVSAGSSDVFVAKYDAAGNYIWAKRMGGTDQEFGKSIAIDANYNVYTTGYWSNIADFDPGASVFNMNTGGSTTDAFISKLDASGNFVFAKQFAGVSHTYGYSIDLDPAGNIYTTGYFGGTVDFDPGTGTYNLATTLGGDIFISKLDGNGDFVWAKAIIGSTTSNDIGYDLVVDNAQNVYLTGVFTGTADFDPGVGVYSITTTSYSNAYLCKLDVNGNFSWAINWGDANNVDAKSIDLDNNQNLYITGFYVNTVDFNPGAGVANLSSNNGSGDMYLLKLSDCTQLSAPSSITGNTTICAASQQTYIVPAVSGASAYTWTLPSGWTGSSTSNSITATPNATGGTISVTANSTCGSSPATTLSVSVVASSPSALGSISGNTLVCAGSSSVYSIPSVAGATSYSWTMPSGWTGASTSNSITASASSNAGSISVVANNVCGSSTPANLNITVNSPLSAPGTITGPTAVCSGSSNSYAIPLLNGASTYSWTLPSGWSGSSSSNSISATAGTLSGTLSVTASNACGTSAASSLTIPTVMTLPVTPSAIIGSMSVCASSAQAYSITPAGDASTYTWTLPSGWAGSSTTSSINATAGAIGGTISVIANNMCGTSASSSVPVAILVVPATPSAITGVTSLCASGTSTYSIVVVSGASNYVWNLPAGWSGTSNSLSIDAQAGETGGNISVQAENACGNSAAQTLAILVNPLPIVSIALTTDILCINANAITLSGGAPAGGVYSGIGVNASDFIPATAGVGSHSINYTYTDGNACSNSATDVMTVDACLGVAETSKTPSIEVFPTPTNGAFTMRCEALAIQKGTITIYSLLGDVIYTIQSQSAMNQLDISHLSNGVYFAKIEIGNWEKVVKILKQ